MDIVTIDMETYYDRDYSLSKMTTEAYVRDPRFEVIGVAIKVNGYPTDWYAGSDPGRFLRQLDYRDKAILCHNTAFDGAILSWHYGIRPKLWLDTLSMARPLHNITVGGSLKALAEHYGLGAKGDEVLRTLGMRRADFSDEAMARFAEYCIKDVDLTYKLFRRLAKGFPPSELQLIDQILRMYTEPMLVLDTELLNQHLEAVVTRRQELVESLGFDTSDNAKSTLMSNDKFADYLRACGVEPPMKTSKTTGKPAYAFSKTDKAFTDMVEHPDERVSTAVAARLGVKSTIEESRTRSLLGVASRGPLPILLNYYGAHTGRLSGGDKMNLQNLPRGGALRRSLRAPDGMVLVACDSSQIEARMVAWLAGQKDLVQLFADKRDVYCEFASVVYGRTITKADKLERFVGKTCVLGLGYGMGAAKFRDSLALGLGGIKVNISEDEAKRIVRIYRDRNHRIAALWYNCNTALSHMMDGMDFEIAPAVLPSLVAGKDGIRLPNDLFIRYPALQALSEGYGYANDVRQFREALKAKVLGDKMRPDQLTRIYGGKVVENCLTGDTQVLTERGWVPLVEVKVSDRVWDGVEWVNHDGLIFQGYRFTTIVDGVRMTPDHKVLTKEGWRCASSCEGLFRADFWLPDGTFVRGDEPPPIRVEVPVPVRHGGGARGYRRGEVRAAWRVALMRLQAWGQELHARYVKEPRLLDVAGYVGSVQAAHSPSMAQLRRTRHPGVPAMGDFVPSVLGGYGSNVSPWTDDRPAGQRRALHTGELSVGGPPNPGQEQAELPPGGYGKGPRHDGGSEVNAGLSLAAEAVYDLRNAGPRTRFMVRGASGPLIVHNCVQALARIVVTDQLVEIGKRYKVVLQVHDEVVIMCSEDEAEEAKMFVEGVMSTAPEWAAGLPVACEAGIGKTYGDSK